MPTNKKHWLYTPIPDDRELTDTAWNMYLEFSQHYLKDDPNTKKSYVLCQDTSQPLANVGDGDVVYVIAHGRKATSNQIAAKVRGNIVYMTVQQLADQLLAHGLKPAVNAAIKLIVCYSGLERGHLFTRDEQPLGGLLYAALRKRDAQNQNKRVAGYRGAFQNLLPTDGKAHKVVSSGFEDHRLPKLAGHDGGDWKNGKFTVEGFEVAHDARVWFDEAWFQQNRSKLPSELR